MYLFEGIGSPVSKQNDNNKTLHICQGSIWKPESGEFISQMLERPRSQQRGEKQSRDEQSQESSSPPPPGQREERRAPSDQGQEAESLGGSWAYSGLDQWEVVPEETQPAPKQRRPHAHVSFPSPYLSPLGFPLVKQTGDLGKWAAGISRGRGVGNGSEDKQAHTCTPHKIEVNKYLNVSAMSHSLCQPSNCK